MMECFTSDSLYRPVTLPYLIVMSLLANILPDSTHSNCLAAAITHSLYPGFQPRFCVTAMEETWKENLAVFCL